MKIRFFLSVVLFSFCFLFPFTSSKIFASEETNVRRAIQEDVEVQIDNDALSVVCRVMGGTWNREEERCETPPPPTPQEYCLEMGGEWRDGNCLFTPTSEELERLKAALCSSRTVNSGTCTYTDGRCVCTMRDCPSGCSND